MVLGIEDTAVGLAFVLSLLSAVACVVYGVVNWNKGAEPMKTEDVDWAKEEKAEVEDAL
jgi:Na+-transporting methylmalonyl-CoA/oxaloacetate decarboxylase gamma subunit